MAAKKRLSQKDIKFRAQIKAKLQAEGRLPPDKPKLNRAQFCDEAKEILRADNGYTFICYLTWAFAEMLGHSDSWKSKRSRSLQAVGAAKVIKLAKARMDFDKEQGGITYTTGDLYEVTKDIFNA